jgi:transketolase
MPQIRLIPPAEFQRVRAAQIERPERLALIADMCRANALAAVKRAGSGHIGSSFSAMDIVVSLYCEEMNVLELGIDHPDRDVYFSSKGHDVPGLYAVLQAFGVIPEEKLLELRRLGGLDGHPDIGVPGIEANSGSLGMGLSKGRGIAWAKRALGRGGHVFVMTGDGELQEGQIYEALQSTAQQGISGLTAIVDHNKVQSDKLVEEIVDLGPLDQKFRDFGWHVARCDGHDFGQLEKVFSEFRTVTDRPKVLIADTIKGRGVSFMEHPAALRAGKGLYAWHAGAPDDEMFERAHGELLERVIARARDQGLEPPACVEPQQLRASAPASESGALGEPTSQAARRAKSMKASSEFVAEAFGDALVELAESHPELVVLDADLSSDCRIRRFERTYPDRFIENGIAEQDMVSMAGGLARQGLLPVVNSFAAFLASRANEQIYNNAGENTKIIYACHYAGLIPAGPGKSHQSLRDISLLGALPNLVVIQPCNTCEARPALGWCVEEARESCALRLVIGTSPRTIETPEDHHLVPGRGATLVEGRDALLFGYGPVMLHEALLASELLAQRGISLAVVNMPWLNRVDLAWLAQTIGAAPRIFVLEDHAPVGGLGDRIGATLLATEQAARPSFAVFGVDGHPACGSPPEALRFHGLDGASLAQRIEQACEGP